MCGIFGHIGTSTLKIEANMLPHRGPDDWGVVNFSSNNKYITLFQSRLSIIGLGVQGHQPFQKYSGKVLIYNGELYNFIEIRNKLISDFNINFITSTDTEVIYEAIINWGIDETLELINGMYAFAYYDDNLEDIYIVRDNLGIKPLYYSQQNDNLIFSSEIKVFFEYELRKAELNKEYLGEYFANGWIYEPHTLFKNIYKIEAGHYLKFNILSSLLTDIKYWDISETLKNGVIPNIENIVLNQTMSDVPIGNYFSGGIDSSIITYLLKDKNILNLNLSMDDLESQRVDLMEKAYNLNLKKLYHQKENLEVYKYLVYYLDEPISDPAIIPAFRLAKESREMGYIVMMSGMGGDEIDSGYSRHTILTNRNLLRFAHLIPKIIIQKCFKGKKLRDILRLKEFASDISPENYFSLTSYFAKSEISSLIKSEEWYKTYSTKIINACQHIQVKKKYYYLDIVGFLASHNLIYMDKASMAASVEVRVPLLDKNLAKYFFNDIDKKKYNGKKRLKRFLAILIGKNYRDNRKEGFRYEINNWLVNEIDWNEITEFFQKNKLIETNQLKFYIEEIENNLDGVSMKLWAIYTLFLWISTFNVKID